jgi:VWFA-related protein
MNSDLTRGWPLLCWLTLASLTTGGWFQALLLSQSEVPTPTVRVSTHLVLVDAVVTGKQGKAISGRHSADFEIEENGKAQRISTFSAPGESLVETQPLPPGIFSNKTQYRSPGGPITILLLDALNTPFKDQAYARRQMLRFVLEQHRSGQRMAVFTLTSSMRVLQDFTSDPRILVAALQRYIPQPQQMAAAVRPATSLEAGTPSAASNTSAIDSSVPPLGDPGTHDAGLAPVQAGLEAFESAQTAYQEDKQVILTLNAMNSLARVLGGLPGRKNLIWVTERVPFSLIPENRSISESELAETLPSLNTRRVSEHSAGSNAATMRQSHAEEIRETASRLSSAQVAI